MDYTKKSPSLLSLCSGGLLGIEEVYNDLQELGYTVHFGIFSAEEVGAPHRRERLFILAIRPDLLADSGSSGFRRQHTGRLLPETQRGREEMGHTTEQGLSESGQRKLGELPAKKGQRLHNRSKLNGSDVANTEDIRERSGGKESGKDDLSGEFMERAEPGGNSQPKFPLSSSFSDYQFPAGPGQQPYEWEFQRTIGNAYRLPNTIRTMWSDSRKGFAKMLGKEIWEETDYRIKAHFKPTLGTSANGYDYREDLLRMAGNGVVWQTAELAFLTLIRKFNPELLPGYFYPLNSHFTAQHLYHCCV